MSDPFDFDHPRQPESLPADTAPRKGYLAYARELDLTGTQPCPSNYVYRPGHHRFIKVGDNPDDARYQ